MPDDTQNPGPDAVSYFRDNPSAACENPAGPRPKSTENPAKDTLFYDGQCPLCLREMDKLRQVRGDDIALVDIHTLENDSPVSADTLLRTLHLKRADGHWLKGADANVAAWEGTQQQRWLRVLRWPIIRSLVDLGYKLWAGWRYERLYSEKRTGNPAAAPTVRETSDAP